ncbi:MAG: hypothetical protein ABSE39_08285 [Candidatus Bathyarchaeia archaeon]
MSVENADRDSQADPDEVSKSVDELCELVSKLPVASTLSNVALRTFLINPGVQSVREPLSIFTEYVTWLYVSIHKSTPELTELNNATSEEDIEHIRDLTKKVIEAVKGYHSREKRGAGRLGDSIEDILDATRIANLFVRGEAFPHHLSAQLHSLLDPFQTELKRMLGFDIAQALDIYSGIGRLINDRIHGFVVALIRDSETDSPDLGRKLTRHETRRLSDEFISFVSKELRPTAHRIFTVTCDEIALMTGLDHSVVRSFLDFFTTEFGQSDTGAGWPSVHETLERAPFLKLSSDLWLIHLGMNSIFRFRSAIEHAIEQDPVLWRRYQNHRSDYLERHAVSLIKSTSPHANGWIGLNYTFDDGDGTRDFELDGLVLVDQTAFLVEAKAGTMSPAARRGSKSAIDQVKRLVDEAQQQTARAARYIRSAEEVCFRGSKGAIRVRQRKLSRIYLISVTLDSLNAFTANKSWLTRSGIVKSEPAWSVCDLDLQVVSELVSGVGEMVSFLDFRLAANNVDQFIVTEELDWLGLFFISGGQPLVPTNTWGGVLLADFADSIRDYYTRNEPGLPPRPKPRQVMPRTMAILMETLERNGPLGFIDAIAILLALTEQERKHFSKSVERLWRSGKKRENLAFRMRLETGSVLCYSTSREMFKDYAKVAKYSFNADLGLCILQTSKQAAQVFVERYPWREDASLKEFSRKFRERHQVKSHVEFVPTA